MVVPTIVKSGRRWAILVFLALLACTSITDSNRERTLRCGDCVEVTVNRVIDGDTLGTSRGRVRLFGVDTPERGERCALEAIDRLKSLAGDSVRLEDGPRLTDQFGRVLAYAYSTEGGASIDETLIREGLATAWTRRRPIPGFAGEPGDGSKKAGDRLPLVT
jgi:endonuclease YncB( thermonuclease family)